MLLTIFLIVVLSGCNSFPTDPVNNEITTIQQLGKAIFFDSTLSNPAGMSCASCHSPNTGFADPDTNYPVSKGAVEGRFGNRNTSTIAYSAYSCSPYHDPNQNPGGMMGGLDIGGQFWDGRAASLEEQAKGPFLNPLEMNLSNSSQIITIIRKASYAGAFDKIFGSGSLTNDSIAFKHVLEALAAYEKTNEVSPFSSKFDYSLKGTLTLNDEETNGYHLFTGKAKCVKCHSIAPVGPSDHIQQTYLFSNYGYQNTGVPKNPKNPYYNLPSNLNPDGANYIDIGRGQVTGLATDKGKFKIPTLRNVAITPPYMHNGVFTTLKQCVHFYNTRDEASANWPLPEVIENVHRHNPPQSGTLGSLKLTDSEENAIVAFLKTLTDGY